MARRISKVDINMTRDQYRAYGILRKAHRKLVKKGLVQNDEQIDLFQASSVLSGKQYQLLNVMFATIGGKYGDKGKAFGRYVNIKRTPAETAVEAFGRKWQANNAPEVPQDVKNGDKTFAKHLKEKYGKAKWARKEYKFYEDIYNFGKILKNSGELASDLGTNLQEIKPGSFKRALRYPLKNRIRQIANGGIQFIKSTGNAQLSDFIKNGKLFGGMLPAFDYYVKAEDIAEQWEDGDYAGMFVSLLTTAMGLPGTPVNIQAAGKLLDLTTLATKKVSTNLGEAAAIYFDQTPETIAVKARRSYWDDDGELVIEGDPNFDSNIWEVEVEFIYERPETLENSSDSGEGNSNDSVDSDSSDAVDSNSSDSVDSDSSDTLDSDFVDSADSNSNDTVDSDSSDAVDSDSSDSVDSNSNDTLDNNFVDSVDSDSNDTLDSNFVDSADVDYGDTVDRNSSESCKHEWSDIYNTFVDTCESEFIDAFKTDSARTLSRPDDQQYNQDPDNQLKDIFKLTSVSGPVGYQDFMPKITLNNPAGSFTEVWVTESPVITSPSYSFVFYDNDLITNYQKCANKGRGSSSLLSFEDAKEEIFERERGPYTFINGDFSGSDQVRPLELFKGSAKELHIGYSSYRYKPESEWEVAYMPLRYYCTTSVTDLTYNFELVPMN